MPIDDPAELADRDRRSGPARLTPTVPHTGDEMETETTLATTDEATVVPTEQPPAELVTEDEGDEFTVIARYPYQMESCQKRLVEWCKKKVDTVDAETADLSENLDIAVKHKWGTGGISRALDRSKRTGDYYRKILAALEAGHCIVPNFPVEMFAIRTKRKNPDPKQTKGLSWGDQKIQQSQILPAGEGEYKDPNPEIYHHTLPTGGKDSAGKDETAVYHFAKNFRPEIDFPFATAKPAILSAAARALADKVFDEIGVLPGRRPKGDPILIGRIRDPRGDKFNRKAVSFLIAWFVDTREL